MSREIDLTKRLSDEDRAYLEQRDRWQDILRNAEEFGGDTSKVALPKELPQTGHEATQNALGPTALTREQERESLLAALEALDKADAQEAEDGVDYEAMKVDELKAELDSRKADAATDEERANLDYGPKDNKAQLIARLDKDDELVAGRS